MAIVVPSSMGARSRRESGRQRGYRSEARESGALLSCARQAELGTDALPPRLRALRSGAA